MSYVDGNPISRQDMSGMQWYNYVPVIGTLIYCNSKHPGDSIGDYPTSISPTDAECGLPDAGTAAIDNCKLKVKDLSVAFVKQSIEGYGFHIVGDVLIAGFYNFCWKVNPYAGAVVFFVGAGDGAWACAPRVPCRQGY